jgi:hypothetical protein
MKITKNGHNIWSVSEWFALAPPKKGQDHWVDGRSAKELAKAWFPTAGVISVPEEFSSLVNSSDIIGNVTLCEGEPEAIVRFDPFGGPRNCDLLVHGLCDLGQIAISVEAKADEEFGKTIGQRFDAGERCPGSNVPKRISNLTSAMLEMRVEESRDLRYQLLHGTAAALSIAKKHGAAIAMFIVHEFVTELTDNAKHKQNAADLDRFAGVLSRGRFLHVGADQLFGPMRVPGNTYIPKSVDLYIGKTLRDTRIL